MKQYFPQKITLFHLIYNYMEKKAYHNASVLSCWIENNTCCCTFHPLNA